MQPTIEQKNILEIKGNVVIKARVATGKTTLCRLVVEKALKDGIAPKDIGYVGWLRSYRKEGKKKMAHLPISISTIHALRYKNESLRRRFSRTRDFDELLVEATDKERRFKLLIVDEFQDINPLLYYVLTSLITPDGVIFAIGDDRQKKDWLYKGSSFDPFRQFEKDFGVKCRTMVHNHRNAKAIVAIAERIYSDGMIAVSRSKGQVRFEEPLERNNLVILTRTNHEAKKISDIISTPHYLQYVNFEGDRKIEGDPESTCRIMTIYQFSGREADRVWLIDWETHLDDLEWNLFFIGITRAQIELYITTDCSSICYNLAKYNSSSYGGVLLDKEEIR